MGSTRQYDFITGVESSALPAASDPSADDDFMTKGYADSHYGSGGGGGGLTWTATPGFAPILGVENGFEVWLFEDDQDQKLTTFLKVPANFIAETQVKLKIGIYSPSVSTDNIRMRSKTYLIREDDDAVSQTGNNYESTTAEITLDNATADQYRLVELDLTDADGEINAIDVTSNDMLRIELYRDTTNESSPDSADTRFIPSSTDPKFTV